MSPFTGLEIRPDHLFIAENIAEGSSVLDLGCGTGDLLYKLVNEKKIQGHGVEIDVENVYACISKGVPVVHADIDEGLGDYPDNSFEYVILSQTLQVVKKPNVTLKEMLRVGNTGIVSLLNFGYWGVRNQLYFRGSMPRTKTLPYEWYDTPNIHLTTIKDFCNFCKKENIRIIKQINLGKDRKPGPFSRMFPNLFADLSIFIIQSAVEH